MDLQEVVRELLSHLEIDPCEACQGTGRAEPKIRCHDACATCGGIGEVVAGTILPEEVRALKAALGA